jgi:hypothetical protein
MAMSNAAGEPKTMTKIKEKFLIDARGRKTAVVVDIASYRALLDRLDDLEDALDLDEAVRASTSFRSYDEIRAELKQRGRL